MSILPNRCRIGSVVPFRCYSNLLQARYHSGPHGVIWPHSDRGFQVEHSYFKLLLGHASRFRLLYAHRDARTFYLHHRQIPPFIHHGYGEDVPLFYPPPKGPLLVTNPWWPLCPFACARRNTFHAETVRLPFPFIFSISSFSHLVV